MTICTAITKSHLAYARTLARSMLSIHPAAQVYVLLADRNDGDFDPAAEPFHLIPLNAIGNSQLIQQMSFYYTRFEFCCAVRPFLHRWLWQHTQAPSWVFLDGDIHVVGDMSDVFDTLSSASVLLNPHNTSPAAPEFFHDTELADLQVGPFNAGFVGIRRCEAAQTCVKWLLHRLSRFCFTDGEGMFVDQLWLMHVPQFFADVNVYTHPGANLAHWNLYKRTLASDPVMPERYTADGKPLMFVHFSGWDIDNPGDVSKYAPPYKTFPYPQLPVWKELGEAYRSALLANGYDRCRNLPYAFDRFDDSTPITKKMRRHYYEQLSEGKAPAGSPFGRPGDFARFLDESS